MSEPLHLQYRPRNLREVFGHYTVKDSLKSVLEGRSSQSFLFTGPSGVGKTTLARIVAEMWGAHEKAVKQYDAATHSGADAMRAVIQQLNYKGWESTGVALILDECHALSKQAWQVILMTLEEPPKHAVICLCTTEKTKVPKTAVTRCHTYDLKPLLDDEIVDLVCSVCEDLEIDFDYPAAPLIAEYAEGSARQALVYLDQLKGVQTEEEARELFLMDVKAGSSYDLCRALVKRPLVWSKLQPILRSIRNEDPEYIRLGVLGYFTTAALNETDKTRAVYFRRVLRAFSTGPLRSADKIGPILTAIGELMDD